MLHLTPSSHAINAFPSRAWGLSSSSSSSSSLYYPVIADGGLCHDRNISNNAGCYSGRTLWSRGIRGGYYSPTTSELSRESHESIELESLVKAYGWAVRRLDEADDEEMRQVVRIQAEAFHEPTALFDDFFFQFFQVGLPSLCLYVQRPTVASIHLKFHAYSTQAKVLSGLLYKLRNSPPDRYACLVAKPAAATDQEQWQELVGVVDVTVLREESVLRHLHGEEEYLYVSGIAVSESFRRQKVATALLEACDVLSSQLGYRYLALRAYDDDAGARRLYSSAGYEVVGLDPVWVSMIGRKLRVLMIKKM
ncbi:hypothetical protein SAY87_029051 [Trapa incisa]|uniref:N-acetyltransferase domain-containing protein n=1 Tax=Trapa incisa TaxID=236973 RepID=A0AAN7QPV3_9MYRT|nr:hypothetical protein SAY87_029051 [Trapa incisa]